MSNVDGWEYVTAFATLFLAWGVQEILERPLGLRPAIHDTKTLKKHAQQTSDSYKKEAAKREENNMPRKTMHQPSMLNKMTMRAHTVMSRLTHSVDKKGAFRMEARSSTYFIKGIWNVLLCLASVGAYLINPNWYYRQFVEFDASSTNYIMLRCISASILVFYAWEMMLEKTRAKFNWSIAIHHWLSSFFALLILLRFYLPSAVWYGFTSVQLVFPLWFSLGYRAVFSMKSSQNAKCTRLMAKFCYFWYIFVTILNIGGQIYIYISRCMADRITIFEMISLPVAIVAWLNDDWQLLKSVKSFSEQEYELALHMSDKNSKNNNSNSNNDNEKGANFNEHVDIPGIGKIKFDEHDTREDIITEIPTFAEMAMESQIALASVTVTDTTQSPQSPLD